MKSFFQFLKESASQQAARMGLQGDGHGGWYDRSTGEFVAKTEKGRLKFYNKRQKVGAKDPAQTEKEKNISNPNFVDPSLQQQEPAPVPKEEPKASISADLETGPPPVPKTKGTLTLAFGRFNPPHAGHLQLMDVAAKSAESEDSDYIIVPSRSQDKKKNPLDPKSKIGYMRKMFPDYEEQIKDEDKAKTIFDVLANAYKDGYKNATIMVGQDRLAEFQGLAQKYNGSDLYDFEEISVVSAGARDPDADDVSGMSASKLRAHAAEGDFNSFSKGVPNKMNTVQKREMFNAVRKSMNIKESLELWQIAPKYDQDALREKYIKNEIFKVGDIVENLNTGLVGTVNRRGTNYIICVTENGIMFKSWLRDIKEYTEVKMDSMMRDKIHPNTLVGTNGAFKYVASMTPGALWKTRYVVKGTKAYK